MTTTAAGSRVHAGGLFAELTRRLSDSRAIGALSVVLLVGAWHASVEWLQIFDFRILPPPLRVAETLWEMAIGGELWHHVAASLKRVAIGSVLAISVGVAAGLLMGLSRTAEAAMMTIVDFIRPISPIAWIPLAILWFGLGNGPAYMVIFLAAFFPIVTSTHKGVSGIAINHLRAADTCGIRGFARLWMVIIPAAMPDIMTGIRVGIGIGWMALIAAEFVAAQTGLGYLIEISRQLFATPKVLAGMVTIGVLGFVIVRLLSGLERLATPWNPARRPTVIVRDGERA